jgi:hypothetical protein
LAIQDQLEGKTTEDSNLEFLKLAKVYAERNTASGKYDLAIVYVPDGWPITECPDWQTWNFFPRKSYFEYITVACGALVKPSGAILILMNDDRILERLMRSYVQHPLYIFNKEMRKWHVVNLEVMQRADGTKVMFFFG